MDDLSESDKKLLKNIGKIICECTEGNPSRTMFIQKIFARLDISKDEITRILRLGTERDLLVTPTTNQIRLSEIGVNYFCN